MAGLGISYQKESGRASFSPFLNLDYIKTNINGYNESGTTLLELHYGERSVSSFASSVGARFGGTYSYGWGMLLPTLRLAAVHEFQKKARQISNELVTTPGTGLLVSTDAPDRNYLIGGLGVVGALNNGAQLFLDYEKRTQDRFLSSWALSAGVLIGF
jgi:outer membrane autotransporter protein